MQFRNVPRFCPTATAGIVCSAQKPNLHRLLADERIIRLHPPPFVSQMSLSGGRQK